MERFYGRDHCVELSNSEAEELLREWRTEAARSDEPGAPALVEWFDERLEHRISGFRAFRIDPAPEPIGDEASLRLFAHIVRDSTAKYTRRDVTQFGEPLSTSERRAWLAKMLDILAFVNQARGVHPDTDAPIVADPDVHEVNLRRRWARFLEMSRRENFVFPDDPRYPDPEALLEYLDDILVLADQDDREARREWPFPKILWEREILLEKLGRYDELADTMRRAAALEDDAFKKQTEVYIASLSA